MLAEVNIDATYIGLTKAMTRHVQAIWRGNSHLSLDAATPTLDVSTAGKSTSNARYIAIYFPADFL